MAQLGNVFDILQFNFHAVKGRAAANPIVVQCPGHTWPAAAGAARFPLALWENRNLPEEAATPDGSCCCSLDTGTGRTSLLTEKPRQR